MRVNEQLQLLLIDLVKIPSVSSNISALEDIVNYVENYFKWIDNIYIKKFEFNKKPSIIISNFDGKYADIVLNGHLDVVPPSEENQFEPYEKDWKLYARGAGDMKTWCSIIIYLMKNLLKNGFTKKKISLILTTDEEVWWFDGVGKLVELWYWGDIILIPDAWSLKNIVHAEKWIIQLKIKFRWISGHSSRPWLGENAIDNMIRFYNLIKNYLENTKKLYYSESHWWCSVNLNVVNGWIATNVIPNEVIWNFDIRFTEEFKLEEIVNIVYKFLEKTNGEILSILKGPLLYTDAYDVDVQKYYNIVKNIIWNDIMLVKEHWASDGRFFAEKWSKVILHRPTCWNVHTSREWVKLDELELIYNCFEKFIVS